MSGIGDLAGAKIITAQGPCYQYDAFDSLGNIHRIVDQGGNVTGYFEYDAWGRLLRNTPPPEGTRFAQSAPAWLTLRDDADGVLRLTPTRLYHARIGRFLQRDPQEPHAGDYLCMDNNPLEYVDPFGLVKSDIKTAAEALEAMEKHLENLKQAWQYYVKKKGQAEGLPSLRHYVYKWLRTKKYQRMAKKIAWKHAKGMAKSLRQLFGVAKNVMELETVLSTLIDVISGDEEDAAKAFEKLTEMGIQKVLQAAGLPSFAVKLIFEAGNVGSGLGNWIAQKIAVIRHAGGLCKCCHYTRPQGKGQRRFNVEWDPGTEFPGERCYFDGRGRLYATIAIPVAKGDDGFFATLYKVLTKDLQWAYKRCQY